MNIKEYGEGFPFSKFKPVIKLFSKYIISILIIRVIYYNNIINIKKYKYFTV